MVRDKKIDVYVNSIRALYLELRSGGIPRKEEILKNDITNILWSGLTKSLEHKELVNISIRGKTGSSKSTTGCKIMYVLIRKLMEIGKIKPMKDKELQEYLYSRISSDQTEFLRFALRRKEKGATAALIDEFSTMGETGFNATTEAALYKEHSDLFAQEEVNKISCSPTHINDRNADIILDVVGMNEEKKITRVIVNYRDTTEWMIFPLGMADIYVGDIMEMEFYKRYRTKKFKRLDLLKKHGIRNIKELEFAIITMATYDAMKDVAYIKKQSEDLIMGIIEGKRRELKMQYSMLTLNYVVMSVKGILDLTSEISALKRSKLKAKDEQTCAIIQQGIDQYSLIQRERLEEEERKIQIEREYREIQ